jgi:hypothetical protein
MHVERYHPEAHERYLASWSDVWGVVFDPELLPGEGYVACDDDGPVASLFVYRDPTASVAYVDNLTARHGANGFVLYAALRVLYTELAKACTTTKRVVIDTASPFVVATLTRSRFLCTPVLQYRATARFF